MAYVIGDDCIACGTCIDECPSEAISEGDKYSINPDLCVDCGTCARENNPEGRQNKSGGPERNPRFYCIGRLLEVGKSLLDAAESLDNLILAGSVAETDALR